MSALTRPMGVIAASIVIAGAAMAAVPADESARAQIRALEMNLSAAVNAGDARKVMSCYAPRGLFVFDASPPGQYVGQTDYHQYWDRLFAAFPGRLHVETTDLSVTVVGAFAYGHNIEHASLLAEDGTKTELVLRVSHVYRKLSGQWLIVQEHTSVPVNF
jgi:uncharacterized protein (TIGR02246 family)